MVALTLLLAAEFTVVLGVRGITLEAYVASRDPVSGSIYLIMLCVFAAMPLIVARGANARASRTSMARRVRSSIWNHSVESCLHQRQAG